MLRSLRYMHCIACVRLNAGCQLKEYVDWVKCRSNNGHVNLVDFMYFVDFDNQ